VRLGFWPQIGNSGRRCIIKDMDYGTDFGYGSTSGRGLLYYLIFPVDSFGKGPQAQDAVVFNEQKQAEIWPVFLFLLPAIVLFAGLFLDLGFFSSLFFYAFESILLAFVCKFYIQIDDLAFIFDLALNFWFSCLILSVVFMLFFSIFAIFF